MEKMQTLVSAGVPVTGSPEWHVRHNLMFAQWVTTVHGIYWRTELLPQQRRDLAEKFLRGHGKSDFNKEQLPRLIKH